MSLLFWAPLTNLHDQTALSSHPSLMSAAVPPNRRAPLPAASAPSGSVFLFSSTPAASFTERGFPSRHPHRRDSRCQLKRCRQGGAGWGEQPRKHVCWVARGVSPSAVSWPPLRHSWLAFYRTLPRPFIVLFQRCPVPVCDTYLCFCHPRLVLER